MIDNRECIAYSTALLKFMDKDVLKFDSCFPDTSGIISWQKFLQTGVLTSSLETGRWNANDKSTCNSAMHILE